MKNITKSDPTPFTERPKRSTIKFNKYFAYVENEGDSQSELQELIDLYDCTDKKGKFGKHEYMSFPEKDGDRNISYIKHESGKMPLRFKSPYAESSFKNVVRSKMSVLYNRMEADKKPLLSVDLNEFSVDEENDFKTKIA